MGTGTNLLVLAAVAGSTALIINEFRKAEAEPPVPAPEFPIFPVTVTVDPTLVDVDSFTFEVIYKNNTDQDIRFEAQFEVEDPEGVEQIFSVETLRIPPRGSAIVFWDTGDLLSLRNLDGNWVAKFTTFDNSLQEFLSQTQPVVFPVSGATP